MARMNRPAPVEITYKNMRFLITHNPTNATLNKFIEVSFDCMYFSSDTPKSDVVRIYVFRKMASNVALIINNLLCLVILLIP